MYVDLLILANLAERPRHGYEIKKTVGQVLGGEHALNNGMLYPALRRFEEMGAVERTVERQSGKPDRHIYSLTSVGREILRAMLCEFPPEVARDRNEFLARVSFFDQLEPRDRQTILAARSVALRQALERHERIAYMVRDEHLPMPPYSQRVMTFVGDQVRFELDWIERLRHDLAPDAEEDQP